MTYALHYASADGPGPDATWTVYREQYRSMESDEPISGLTVRLSTHTTEEDAETEARRLQVALPRHMAHRADRFAHPAYRRQEVYAWGGRNGRIPLLVDEYKPKHKK